MKHSVLKYIWDVADSCGAIANFLRGKSNEDYLSDRMLRDAVERELIIIGEALSQAEKLQPDLSNHITDLKKIIAFRSVLVHGYGEIRNELVWSVIKNNLPKLLIESKGILNKESGRK